MRILIRLSLRRLIYRIHHNRSRHAITPLNIEIVKQHANTGRPIDAEVVGDGLVDHLLHLGDREQLQSVADDCSLITKSHEQLVELIYHPGAVLNLALG